MLTAKIHTPDHLRKLLGIYQLDLAMVQDGYRPSSIAVDIWTRDLDQAETLDFIEKRIGVIVAKLMRSMENDDA